MPALGVDYLQSAWISIPAVKLKIVSLPKGFLHENICLSLVVF